MHLDGYSPCFCISVPFTFTDPTGWVRCPLVFILYFVPSSLHTLTHFLSVGSLSYDAFLRVPGPYRLQNSFLHRWHQDSADTAYIIADLLPLLPHHSRTFFWLQQQSLEQSLSLNIVTFLTQMDWKAFSTGVNRSRSILVLTVNRDESNYTAKNCS